MGWRQWKKNEEKKKSIANDFPLNSFLVQRSYAFWRIYCCIRLLSIAFVRISLTHNSLHLTSLFVGTKKSLFFNAFCKNIKVSHYQQFISLFSIILLIVFYTNISRFHNVAPTIFESFHSIPCVRYARYIDLKEKKNRFDELHCVLFCTHFTLFSEA